MLRRRKRHGEESEGEERRHGEGSVKREKRDILGGRHSGIDAWRNGGGGKTDMEKKGK